MGKRLLWKCQTCDVVCTSRKLLYKHKHEVHGMLEHGRKCGGWVCSICGLVFPTKEKFRIHKRENHRIDVHRGPHGHTWICPLCPDGKNVFIGRRSFEQHKKLMHGSSKMHPSFSPGGKCRYCGKLLSKKFSLQRHEACCCENPNRIPYIGHKHTDETKRKLSVFRRKQLVEGIGSRPWINPSIKRSYAEQYFYDILCNELPDNIEWRNNYRICGYMLDFANIKTKVYFEIDGETHYTEAGIAYDKRRTAELESAGWFLIGRLRWKWYTRLNKSDRHKIVGQYIKAFISEKTNTLTNIQETHVNTT